MSKIVRKWVQTNWNEDGALRALDIPYSSSISVTARLDAIKDSTDQSIRLQELTVTPSTESGVGKLFTENGEMYFIDELGNQIRLSRNGDIASVTRTKVESHTEYKVLDAGDVSNKYIDLLKAPDPISSVSFSLLGGNNFQYTEEFAMVRPTGTTEADFIRLTWDPAEDDVTTGLTSLLQTSDVVKITYNCPEEVQGHSVDKKIETFTLDGTDISNKYITLSESANPPTSVEFVFVGGSNFFEYTEDYVVKVDANTEYKTLSWASGDTGTGLESVLLSGDIVQVKYTHTDDTQIRGTEKQLEFFTLDGTDIANKYVDLGGTAANIIATEVSILGGNEVQYTEDFIIKRDSNDQYRRLSWAVADTNTGLEGVLISGDILKVAYMDAVGLIGAIRVSRNDTKPTFLVDKLVAGTNITITANNDGGEETITIASAAGQDKVVDHLTLDGTDISNKYKDLNYIPTEAADTEMTVIGGVDQQYTEDFAIISDGSDVRRLTWDVNNPNVTTGIASLSSGDVLKISYVRTV